MIGCCLSYAGEEQKRMREEQKRVKKEEKQARKEQKRVNDKVELQLKQYRRDDQLVLKAVTLG